MTVVPVFTTAAEALPDGFVLWLAYLEPTHHQRFANLPDGLQRSVSAVSFNGDATHVASSSGATVKIWAAATGAQLPPSCMLSLNPPPHPLCASTLSLMLHLSHLFTGRCAGAHFRGPFRLCEYGALECLQPLCSVWE